jgi:hypothetical protein
MDAGLSKSQAALVFPPSFSSCADYRIMNDVTMSSIAVIQLLSR